MAGRYLSLSEAADALGISERTTYRWIKSGKLRAYKPGRDYRIPEDAISETVEAGDSGKGRSLRKEGTPNVTQRGIKQDADELELEVRRLFNSEQVSFNVGHSALTQVTDLWGKAYDARRRAEATRMALTELNELGLVEERLADLMDSTIEELERRFPSRQDELSEARAKKEGRLSA